MKNQETGQPRAACRSLPTRALVSLEILTHGLSRAKGPLVTLEELGDSLQLPLSPAWPRCSGTSRASRDLRLSRWSLPGVGWGRPRTHSLCPPTARTQPGLRAPRLLPLSLPFPISPEIPLRLCQDKNLESFPLPSFSHLQAFMP